MLKTKLLYSCKQCPKSFVFKFKLKKHRKEVHTEKIFECPSCPKSFTRKYHLQQHKLAQHSDSEFKCITCRKKFKKRRALDKHLEFGEYCSFQCVSCTRTFKRKPNFLKHMQICLTINDSGGTCEICSETFQFGIDLERHRKSSTKPDGSFKCLRGYCGKLNCNFEMLGAHIRAACTGIHCRPTKEFPCEKCGKRFLSKDDMMSHLDSHTN